eukprot:TRINITY_DN30703_c0_g1_i1.p1 TRINITY_DN30703_c0_g1~~TRINITY_DN30703_c0_g1_i1.p1  ORF type:complete len:350 (+),score=82.42 TRINITY_DN30703_c0_g1_i1:53-1051(+)
MAQGQQVKKVSFCEDETKQSDEASGTHTRSKDEEHLPAPSRLPSFSKGVKNWLLTYWPLLLLFAGMVAYQTKLFGHYGEIYVNERLRKAAEASIKFGEVQTEILKHGDGKAVAAGDWTSLRIGGYREDGTLFWNTYLDRAKSFTFQTGQPDTGKIIPGLDSGTIGLTVGSKAVLTIPPDLAYGERGKRSWGIRPWAILKFEIDVLSRSDTAPHEPIKKAKAPEKIEKKEKVREEEIQQAPPEEGKDDPQTLTAVLSSIGVQSWEAVLMKQGFVSINDFQYLENESDLPQEIPLFTRRKLVAYAKKQHKKQDNGEPAVEHDETCDEADDTCNA